MITISRDISQSINPQYNLVFIMELYIVSGSIKILMKFNINIGGIRDIGVVALREEKCENICAIVIMS